MRHIRAYAAAIGLLLLTVCAAGAQTSFDPPRKIRTERITAGPDDVMFFVNPDGSAEVDWEKVAEAARGPDPVVQNIAQTLLAVRDGRWKPMQRRP